MSAVPPAFDDGKAPDALRTIGEVAQALGIRQHVLRYWEDQFPMLRPLTRAGGRRYYRPEDIALVVEIDRLLHHEGYTIKGARQALETRAKGGDRGTTPPLATPPLATPAPSAPEPPPAIHAASADEDRLVDALKVLRAHLAGIRDRLAEATAE